jgi:hypothetical protein
MDSGGGVRRAVFAAVVSLALAAALACGARPGGTSDGSPCINDGQCKSHQCRNGTCAGTQCSCGESACSDLGSVSDDCASEWLCVHHHGDPLYGEPAGNSCLPTCRACPENYRCSVKGQTVCDYVPPTSAGPAGDGAVPPMNALGDAGDFE